VSQGFLIPLPQRLFDSDGAPADGWLIYYTHAGLGTPVTTYSDAGLTSANTFPVETDADGYFRVFVAEAVIVDIDVQNASGVSQYTFESIEAMPDTSGSSPSVTAVPTGGVLAWTTGTAPTGFLLCNGAAVSRATYSTLNTLLSAAGYPYGSGDGSTTFNVPDLRGKFPLGQSTAGTGSTLGGSGGTIDHTHTGPSHTHVVTVTRDGWGETLNTPSSEGRLNTGAAAGAGQFSSSYQPTADLAVTSAAGGTGNTGTGNPPFVSLQFIIKT
jgi:microcystin-dependent protein